MAEMAEVMYHVKPYYGSDMTMSIPDSMYKLPNIQANTEETKKVSI